MADFTHYPPGALPVHQAYQRFRQHLGRSGQPHRHGHQWGNWDRQEEKAQAAFMAPFLNRDLEMEVYDPAQRRSFALNAAELAGCSWPERLLLARTIQDFPNGPLAKYNGLAPYVHCAAYEEWLSKQEGSASAPKPAALHLSQAVWLAAYPDGPSEEDYINEVVAMRRQIEELMPAARRECSARGLDPQGFQLLERWNLSAAYTLLQQHLGQLPNDSAFQRMMGTASQYLSYSDQVWQDTERAASNLQQAAWQDHVQMRGRTENLSSNELAGIDRTYFRLERLILCELGYENKIAPDPDDDDQTGHETYVEVEVDYLSFEEWMRATGRWALEDSDQIQPKQSSPATKSDLPRSRVPDNEVVQWYKDRFDCIFQECSKAPTEEDDWQAARAHFDTRVVRTQVRAARDERRQQHPGAFKQGRRKRN